jgi:acyl-CoA oxidase
MIEYVADAYKRVRPLIFSDPEHADVNELHIIISIFKPICSRLTAAGLQECREACGGHGYLAKARLGQIRDNNDATITWEGDNNIILQQTSRFLLKSIRKVFGGEKNTSRLLAFLNLNLS